MEHKSAKQIELARELYQNAEYDKAEPLLRQAVDENPNFADLLNMLGVIYYNRGQVDRAQDHFERALQINPRYTEAALNLVVALNDLGQYDASRKVFGQVMTFSREPRQVIEPFARGKLANMHAQLGRVYADLGMYDEAVLQYQKALGLCPTFVDLRTQLAQILHEAGRLDEALAELTRVKEQRPEYIPARLALGVACFSKGLSEEASKEWKAILDRDPNHISAQMYLRMVNQILAQQDAAAQGVPLEVDTSSVAPQPQAVGDEELSFTLDENEGHRFQRDTLSRLERPQDPPQGQEPVKGSEPGGKKP